MRAPDVDARLAANDPTLPAALREFDPLLGRRRWPYHAGALRLLEARAQADGRADEAAVLAARRAEIEAHVRPPDPFLADLGGPEGCRRAGAGEVVAARALVAFDRALGALPVPRDERLELAAQALEADRAGEALGLLDAALALAPASQEARYTRALALRKLGRGAESRDELRVAAGLDPETALARYIEGMLAYQADDLPGAERELRAAIGVDGTMARARVALATVLIDLGRLDEAETQLRTAAVLITDPVDVRPLLAEIARQRAAGPGKPAADG